MTANPVQIHYPLPAIAVVQIHRPEARNALNHQVRHALAAAFEQLRDDAAIRVIILTGGDSVFAAGADLTELARANPIELYQRHSERYWQAIAECPKPVIAVVNGFALGGGCELAMHADVIIAGESAQFGQPEVKVGIMPGAGGTQRLVRAVGKFHAMRMLLTGCLIPANEAYQMGLVSMVCADQDTLNTAYQYAQQMAALAPLALAQIKETVLLGQDLPLQAALALERRSFQFLFASQDQREGMQAFLDKRPAQFQGQ